MAQKPKCCTFNPYGHGMSSDEAMQYKEEWERDHARVHEEMERMTMIGKEEIEKRFGFHKASIEGKEATLPRHSSLRVFFKSVANELDKLLPESREKSLAFTALEEASMWSHKAVAQSAPVEVDREEDIREYEALREKIHIAVGREVTKNSIWPKPVQTPMLGRDLSEPIDTITDAVLSAMTEGK